MYNDDLLDYDLPELSYPRPRDYADLDPYDGFEDYFNDRRPYHPRNLDTRAPFRRYMYWD